MNSLQNLQTQKNFFVSINPYDVPKNYYDKTFFEHPIFNLESLTAQKRINEIQGQNNTWFCGSYCGFGFHEDGIQSAIYIANLLNADLPWENDINLLNRLQFLKK